MTLKNHKNHYNVKFLKGYGHSISVKNSKIILKDCHDPFSEPKIEKWFVKNMPYEKIVLSGKGYVSTEALSLLSQNNRNVILLNNQGNPITFCNGMRDSLTATKYRMAQYDTFRDESKRKYLEKQIISAKKNSQLKLLKLIGSSVEYLPEPEHLASKIYFKEFAKLVPEKYGFVSRNQSFIRNSKENAELSYRISHRTASIVGENASEKQFIFENIRKLYNKRSNIVHGTHTKVSFAETEFLLEVLRVLILKFMSLSVKEYSDSKILDELLDAVFDANKMGEILKDSKFLFGGKSLFHLHLPCRTK